jgi:nucleotide-binding universal stress UspA family protein
MENHILVPLDGSSLAECVLPHVLMAANALAAQVTLLQVVELAHPTDRPWAIDPLDWQIRKIEAKAYLDEVARRLQQSGLQVQSAMEEGQAAERIIEFAHAQHVSLIVLSSHGRSGLSGWNVCSVVQKIILRTHTSTLIVRAYQPTSTELTGLRYRRLLVPLDGSLRAECVMPLATNLARCYGAQLLLAHVVHRPEMPRRMPLTPADTNLVDQIVARNHDEAVKYFEQLGSQLHSEGIGFETHLCIGDNTAAALHDLVTREQADVVLLTAHGQSGVTRWPYGSVATSFIAYGTSPLLIVQDLSPEEVERTQAEMAVTEHQGH